MPVLSFINNKNKTLVIAIISIGFGVFILISGFLIVATLNPNIKLSEEKILVGGLYKRDILIGDITDISLEDKMPKVLSKTNGMDVGYSLRGTFRLEKEENSTLFVQQDKSPFINIRTKDRLYIINFKESEKTIELYNKIKDLIK